MPVTGRSLAIAACLAVGSATAPGDASAQAAFQDSWRLGASAGGFVPRAPMIVGADRRDTGLGAGPSFALDLEYLASNHAVIYGNGSASFSSVTLGTEIRPSVVGPSDQVTLFTLTGGVVLSALPGEPVQPTLRLGGGLKGYAFDLDEARDQWRPTGDIGLGFRGFGGGPIEVSTEVRYLPSTFDQSKLPTRGITPQSQRQTDLLFGVRIGVRF